jgi:hypothetical protein
MTAIEWLIENMPKGYHLHFPIEVIEEAKAMEREQHGQTWDAAIKAHDDRGYVHARSWCDFDDYWEEFKETEK